jgi:hypothetical protein
VGTSTADVEYLHEGEQEDLVEIEVEPLYINRSPGGHEAISTDMTTILKPSLLSPSLLEKFGSPAGIRSTPLRLTDSVFHYPEYLRSRVKRMVSACSVN